MRGKRKQVFFIFSSKENKVEGEKIAAFHPSVSHFSVSESKLLVLSPILQELSVSRVSGFDLCTAW